MKMKDYITGLQHVGLPTDDMEKTLAFYKKLGFTVSYETVNEAAGERVAFLEKDGLVIETYENHQAAWKSGAIDHIALNVSDVEAMLRLAREESFEIVSDGIEELPFWEKGVRFFIVLGPNRERVEFNQIL